MNVRTPWLIAALILTACSEGSVPLDPDMVTSKEGAYVLHLTPSTHAPVAGDDFTLEFMVHDAVDDAMVGGAAVEVVPFMPEHGHGLADDPEAMEMETSGMYTATWAFSMPGYWEVTVHVDAEPGHDHAVFGYEVE